MQEGQASSGGRKVAGRQAGRQAGRHGRRGCSLRSNPPCPILPDRASCVSRSSPVARSQYHPSVSSSCTCRQRQEQQPMSGSKQSAAGKHAHPAMHLCCVCHPTHRHCLGGAAATAPAARPCGLLSCAAPGTAGVARWQVHGGYHQYHGCGCHLIMLQYRLKQGAVPAVELSLIPAEARGR